MKFRTINVVERVNTIGRRKCQALIGLHNFTGADWGGTFVGISKNTWTNAFMTFNDDDPAVHCLVEMGKLPVP